MLLLAHQRKNCVLTGNEIEREVWEVRKSLGVTVSKHTDKDLQTTNCLNLTSEKVSPIKKKKEEEEFSNNK